MKKSFLWAAIGCICLILSACDWLGSNNYISVQLEDSEMWSLLDAKKGEVVFADEFFSPSTQVVKGSFFVQNKKGKFDLYNLDDTRNRLNRTSYSIISSFNKDGYAIVRVKNEPWQIINTKGETLSTLNKNIIILSGFSDDGLARFTNKKNQVGYINTKGEVVIKPRFVFGTVFSDGVAFVINKQTGGVNHCLAINTKGEILYRFTDSKFSGMTLYKDGYCFAVEDGKVVLLDKDGRKVMRVCKATVEANSLSIHDGKVTYFDGEYYGVKDLEGKILIRAKYRYLKFNGDGTLTALNTSNSYGVVNTNDEIVMPFEYEFLTYLTKGRYLSRSANVFVLIDESGKEIGTMGFNNFYDPNDYFSLSRKFDLIVSPTDGNASEYDDARANYFQNLMDSSSN